MTRLPSIILLLIALIATVGCERHDTALEARVDEAYRLADINADSAIALLGTIAPEAAAAPEASLRTKPTYTPLPTLPSSPL